MTLVWIMLTSLLVFSAMQQALIYFKALNQLEQQHQELYQLERVATHLAKADKVHLNPKCILQENGVNAVIRQLKQRRGCPVHDVANYMFLIEDLGDWPCRIATASNQKVSTHHRRVTVLSPSDSILQIRFISAIPQLFCEGIEQPTELGVSSWRFLDEKGLT